MNNYNKNGQFDFIISYSIYFLIGSAKVFRLILRYVVDRRENFFVCAHTIHFHIVLQNILLRLDAIPKVITFTIFPKHCPNFAPSHRRAYRRPVPSSDNQTANL